MTATRRSNWQPASVRFWRFVEQDGDCWLWTGHRDARGYGLFNAGDDRTVRAHRFAYELLVAEIPAGLQLDHLCENKSCVNALAHLDPVPGRVNVHRASMHAANRTHCPAGHEYAGEHLYVDPSGWRHCRTCKNARRRKAAERAA